jgi:hypothetical protein
LEDKLANNNMRLYGNVLRTNEDRIPKKVLNIKVNHLSGKLSSRLEKRGKEKHHKRNMNRKEIT